jgi:hypothetical protein
MNESLKSIPEDNPTLTHLSKLYNEISATSNSIFDLLQHLQIYLYDKRSDTNRRKALQILKLVFENSTVRIEDLKTTEDPKNNQKRNLLIYFFKKLEIDPLLAKEILEIIIILKNKVISRSDFITWFLMFLNTGKFNTQDYKREVRGIVLGILTECIQTRLSGEDQSEEMFEELFNICASHCFNEKDARNLMVVFELFQKIISTSPVNVLRNEEKRISDNLMRYFPITFNNNLNTKIKVSGDSLKRSFLRIFANNIFYEGLLQDALEKLKGEEDDSDAVWDNLQIFFEQMDAWFSSNR